MPLDWPMWNVVVWLVGLIAVWCIASVPAYWFLSAWTSVRNAVGAVLQRGIEYFRDLRATRVNRRLCVAERLRTRMHVRVIDESLLEPWIASLMRTRSIIEEGARQLDRARLLTTKAFKRLEPLARRLQRSRLMSETIPDIPTVDEALLRTKRNRLAIVNLLLAVGLLVPIAAVNAQLTGLVLSEFIPPVQPVFGVPVPFVLALVLVIAEAGVGLLHSAESEKHWDSERRLTLGLVIWSAVGIGVVALETALYSQVDPGSLTTGLPVAGSAFGLMGAILGSSVFGLGRLAHSSLATIRRERTPGVVAKQLVHLRYAADDWNTTAQRLQPAQQIAAEGCQQLVQLCQDVSQAERQSIETFKLEVQKCREFPPPWATPVERALTDAEFSERESGSYLWSAVGSLATLSLAGLAAAFGSRMLPGYAFALGIGIGFLAFAVGALAARLRGWRIVTRVVVPMVLWLGTVASVIVASRLLRGAINIYALALLIPATAVYVSGLMVGDAIGLLRLPALWVIDVVAYASCALAISAVWLVSFVASLVEQLAKVIAWPTSALVGIWIRRRSSETIRAASV